LAESYQFGISYTTGGFTRDIPPLSPLPSDNSFSDVTTRSGGRTNFEGKKQVVRLRNIGTTQSAPFAQSQDVCLGELRQGHPSGPSGKSNAPPRTPSGPLQRRWQQVEHLCGMEALRVARHLSGLDRDAHTQTSQPIGRLPVQRFLQPTLLSKQAHPPVSATSIFRRWSNLICLIACG
jgi:hypothetical protein